MILILNYGVILSYEWVTYYFFFLMREVNISIRSGPSRLPPFMRCCLASTNNTTMLLSYAGQYIFSRFFYYLGANDDEMAALGATMEKKGSRNINKEKTEIWINCLGKVSNSSSSSQRVSGMFVYFLLAALIHLKK